MTAITDSTNAKLLNVGLYTPAEAAHYARVRTSLMVRWIHGNMQGASVVTARFKSDPEKTVTFVDFVQALAIRAIRLRHRVPLPKIREAIEHTKTAYSIDFPFARKHKTFIFDDDIHIELAGRKGKPSVQVQISGAQRGQAVMSEVTELYMEKITYGADGIANKYVAFEHESRKVIMDPARKFGEPFVEGCGYSVASILNAWRTEGSKVAAAKTLGIQVVDVDAALWFEDYLQGSVGN